MISLSGYFNQLFEYLILKNLFTVILVILPIIYFFIVKMLAALSEKDLKCNNLPQIKDEDEKIVSEMSPGMMRYILKGKYDSRCFTADLIQLYEMGKLDFNYNPEYGGLSPYFNDENDLPSNNIIAEKYTYINSGASTNEWLNYKSLFFFRLIHSYFKELKRYTSYWVVRLPGFNRGFLIAALSIIACLFSFIYLELPEVVERSDDLSKLCMIVLMPFLFIFFFSTYNLSKFFVGSTSNLIKGRFSRKLLATDLILYSVSTYILCWATSFNVYIHFSSIAFCVVYFKLQNNRLILKNRGKMIRDLIADRYEFEKIDDVASEALTGYTARRVAFDQIQTLLDLPDDLKSKISLLDSSDLKDTFEFLGFESTPEAIVDAIDDWVTSQRNINILHYIRDYLIRRASRYRLLD